MSTRKRSQFQIISQARPIVTEVVGPAGAGKTTLLQTLSKRDGRILPGLTLPKTTFIPTLVNNSLVFAPSFLRHYRHDRWFTLGEMRSMAYLTGWQQVLRRRPPSGDMVTVLDHGPIFRLAMLREFGPEITESQTYASWENTILNEWAATLHLVVWLDAPDSTLLERVNSRDLKHRMKERPEQEVYEFLARYRRAYEQIIAAMTADGPTVLRVNSHRQSVDEIADSVLNTLKLHRPR